ncbi:MAG: hypothetical protein QOH43_1988 [Solirubrobacteraceae bacterium]|jgi:uncharacterized membrane protein YczE|nr:hypothetical protein [Solirubrobacteraceae bacterium]
MDRVGWVARAVGIPPATLWRTPPRVLVRLLAGLWVFGAGEGLVVAAGLGTSPWTVLAQGVERQTPLSVGEATIVLSFALLAIWIPLQVRPGIGTLLNAVLVGVSLDATLSLLGPAPLAVRIGELAAGIALVGVGSGLYLGAARGPGPRDGLMLGLHARTGRPLALLRGGIELTALAAGAALGGTVGVGTLAFALLVGPAVATGLRVIGPAREPLPRGPAA